MMDTDIISQVQYLERKGNIVEVEVAVTGPVSLLDRMKQRARARALIAAGVLPTTFETISDVSEGDIRRLTNVVSERRGEDVKIDSVPVLGKLLQTKVYTIHVNRE